jgi:hypothetical protein
MATGELDRLGEQLRRQAASGEPLEHEEGGH